MPTRDQGRHFEDYEFAMDTGRVKVAVRYIGEGYDRDEHAAHFTAMVGVKCLSNTDLNKLHDAIRAEAQKQVALTWAHYIQVEIPEICFDKGAAYVQFDFDHLLLSTEQRMEHQSYRVSAPCWRDHADVAWYGYPPDSLMGRETSPDGVLHELPPPNGLPPRTKREWVSKNDILLPYTPSRWQTLGEIKAQIIALRDRLLAMLGGGKAEGLLDSLAEQRGPALLTAGPAVAKPEKGKRRG